MQPGYKYVSHLTFGPEGIVTYGTGPVDGAKSKKVSSALILHSIAYQFIFRSLCLNGNGSPFAISS